MLNLMNNLYQNNFTAKLQKNSPCSQNTQKYKNISSLNADAISFKGVSRPSEYHSTFDYLASNILKSSPKKYGVGGEDLSSQNISKGVDIALRNSIDLENEITGEKVVYTKSNVKKIKWKPYVANDVREYCIDKINDARTQRLTEWKNFLNNPEKDPEIVTRYPSTTKLIKENKALKFVIWSEITKELKENNRHIPTPLNLKALSQTIETYQGIPNIARNEFCTQKPFSQVYTHRLRDNVLMRKGLGDNNKVWVKFSSSNKDKDNKAQNISDLEILSDKNWCTRSSVDKAEAALDDGDFYIYLEKNYLGRWRPTLGVATSKGKVDQIQGELNDNFIPTNQIENIKNFFNENNLKCASGVDDEHPKATQQLLIAEKMAKEIVNTDVTLENSIKNNNYENIFNALDINTNRLSNGLLEIDSYKPNYCLDEKSGISVPLSMLDINEDKLLEHVETINGNLNLYHKNDLFASHISKFPANLKKVKGNIECSEEQYEKFKEDFARVTNNPRQIRIKH